MARGWSRRGVQGRAVEAVRRGGCVQRQPQKEKHPTDGQDCKNRRPQEDDGHDEVDRLSEVQEADAHRQAREGPRARRPRRRLHFVLGVRFLREALER